MKSTLRIHAKKTSIAIILSFVCFSGFAKKLPGFIITNNQDTINGYIKISRFDLVDGSYFLNSINLEPLFSMVTFKADDGGPFKNFFPGEIKGFTFHYEKQIITFEYKELAVNSIFASGMNKKRFVRLVYLGKVSMYEDIENVTPGGGPGHGSYAASKFYLFNDTVGMTKLETTKEKKSLKDILGLYITDSEFDIPADIKLVDIKGLLMQYDHYLTKKN
jgi:hypothetical protein